MSAYIKLLRALVAVWVLLVGATVATEHYAAYSFPWWVILAGGGATVALILIGDDWRRA